MSPQPEHHAQPSCCGFVPPVTSHLHQFQFLHFCLHFCLHLLFTCCSHFLCTFLHTCIFCYHTCLCWLALVYAGSHLFMLVHTCLCWLTLVYAGSHLFMLVHTCLCWFTLVYAGSHSSNRTTILPRLVECSLKAQRPFELALWSYG